MCELLIRNRDNINPDVDKDRMSYKRGDIVEGRPDGANYGKNELDESRFRIVKIPGVPVEEYQLYTSMVLQSLDSVVRKGMTGKRRLLQMRQAARHAIKRRHHYMDDDNNIHDRRLEHATGT